MKRVAEKVTYMFNALYAGSKLLHVKPWKEAGAGIALVSAFLSAVVGLAVSYGWIDKIDDETIMKVSSVLVTGVSVILWFIQVATTEKIGFKPKPGMPEPVQEFEEDDVITDDISTNELRNTTVQSKTRPPVTRRYKPSADPRGMWAGDDR